MCLPRMGWGRMDGKGLDGIGMDYNGNGMGWEDLVVAEGEVAGSGVVDDEPHVRLALVALLVRLHRHGAVACERNE